MIYWVTRIETTKAGNRCYAERLENKSSGRVTSIKSLKKAKRIAEYLSKKFNKEWVVRELPDEKS